MEMEGVGLYGRKRVQRVFNNYFLKKKSTIESHYQKDKNSKVIFVQYFQDLGNQQRHQLSELTQTHVHRVGDATQPSHPLLSPCYCCSSDMIFSTSFLVLSDIIQAIPHGLVGGSQNTWFVGKNQAAEGKSQLVALKAPG